MADAEKPEESQLQWLESRRSDLAKRMYALQPIEDWLLLKDLHWAFTVRIERELQRQLEEKKRQKQKQPKQKSQSTQDVGGIPRYLRQTWSYDPGNINCSLAGAAPPWQWSWSDIAFVPFSDMNPIPGFLSAQVSEP